MRLKLGQNRSFRYKDITGTRYSSSTGSNGKSEENIR